MKQDGKQGLHGHPGGQKSVAGQADLDFFTRSQAGIYVGKIRRSYMCLAWVPAFAGTTLRNRPEDPAPGLLPRLPGEQQ